MKKILLGCGILVLLGLGFLGYVVWAIWPQLQGVMHEAEQAETALQDLDVQYPFEASEDELDTERMAQYLDMRVTIRANIDTWMAEMEATGERLDDDDIGFIEKMRMALDKMKGMPATVVPVLDEAQMGGSEFSYHTRLFWAALQTIDAGVSSDPRLVGLRGHYPELKGAFNAERQSDGPTLTELIGDFPPRVLEQARAVMATLPARVEDGIGHPKAEVAFLAYGNESLRDGGRGLDVDVTVDGEGR